MSDITRMLDRVQEGDLKAAEELLPLVYEELRRLAAHKMAAEPSGHTLQPTALVHEAWLRLAGPRDSSWNGRNHFFMAAAEAMRRILIERARRKGRQKRGAHAVPIPIHELDCAAGADSDALLLVEEALEQLAARDSLKANLVKLRFFVGLNLEEAGQVLGLSEATAKRHWAWTRAWLYEAIEKMR